MKDTSERYRKRKTISGLLLGSPLPYTLLEFARRVRSGDHEGGMGANQVQTR